MKLEAEGQRAIVDPQGHDIELAVTRLALPDRTFLILSRSETSYLQVRLVDSNRHAFECREGSAEQHLRSAREDFSSGEAIEILEAYRRGGESWRSGHEWRRLEVPARKDIWARVGPITRIAGLVLMFDAAFAVGRPDGDPIFGLEALDVLSIAFVLAMTSSVIDLRRSEPMGPLGRSRNIATLVAGALVLVIELIEHLSTR